MFVTPNYNYKLIKDPLTNEIKTVKRTTDSAFIPFNEANTDYQEYLAWVAKGNTAEEAD